jgi:hypothetical protein
MSEVEDVPLTMIEQKYIMMFNLWKRHNLWPWQCGYAEEPCIEHIRALEIMDDYYNKAQAFWSKRNQQQNATSDH